MPDGIHAELMAQYAEDARETETPWERWEMITPDWLKWEQMSGSPSWHKEHQYRRKPRAITINGRKVPEPMREAPKVGEKVYLASIDVGFKFNSITWEGDGIDRRLLSRGLVHSTEEAAIAHAEALLSFTEERK